MVKSHIAELIIALSATAVFFLVVFRQVTDVYQRLFQSWFVTTFVLFGLWLSKLLRR